MSQKFAFLFFHFFVSSVFSDQMTGPMEDNERQLSAARSTTTTTPPIDDTDEYLHQMMVRLSPNEEIVRRLRPGK